MSSAQGQDRSADQDVYPWAGLDFGFAKATNGLGYTDPYFASNWANLAAEGKVRGAYHELTASSSAGAQAAFFVATVKGRGLRELDMLAVVASDYAGVTGGDVESFCAEASRLAGPHNPVIVYTDLSYLPNLTGCTRYELWVTWPSDHAPESVWPFADWRFWQYSITGPVDLDAYNGTAADLRAWLQTYAPHPDPKPKPAPAEEDDAMAMLENGTDAVTAITCKGGTQTGIGFGGDPGLTGAPEAVLRVACWSNAHGYSQIVESVKVGNGRATVDFTEGDVSVISVMRVAGNEAADNAPLAWSWQ